MMKSYFLVPYFGQIGTIILVNLNIYVSIIAVRKKMEKSNMVKVAGVAWKQIPHLYISRI